MEPDKLRMSELLRTLLAIEGQNISDRNLPRLALSPFRPMLLR